MAWKYSSPTGTNPSRQIPRPGRAGVSTKLAATQGTPIGPGALAGKVGVYERPEQVPRSWLPLVMIGAVALIAVLVWLWGMFA